jgi:predicted O-methyltransferase YrrM
VPPDPIAEFLAARFAPEDASLLALREAADREGLPPTTTSPQVGRLLQLLLHAAGTTRALEVGTLGGWSAAWIARALPAGGRLVTIEQDPRHAAFAREWITRLGLTEKVEIRTGRALDHAPLPRYLDWAIRLTRPGGFIVADNALAGGRFLGTADDEATRGLREFHRMLAEDPRIEGMVLGAEDGIGVAVVR